MTNLGAFAKSLQATFSVVLSVCPHEATGIRMDGFSWKISRYHSQ